jgi:hypothetical protein
MLILYIYPVFRYIGRPTNSFEDSTMNSVEWTLRCAERLHEQWPRVDRSDLENLADALQAEDRWKWMEPQDAAVQWLSQGIPPAISATT